MNALSPCAKEYDVAILGAGLIGRLIGLQLASDGVRVALFDRGGPEGRDSAAWVAAAMLAPLAEAAVGEPLIADLGTRSLEKWPLILGALPEPVFFQRNGTLVVWHAADRGEAAIFDARVRANAPAALLANGGMTVLSGAPAVQAAEPALARRFTQGLLLPDEGQTENRQVLRALGAGLMQKGAALHWNVELDDAALPEAPLVIDCRGLGAKAAWPGLRGIRGEVARVHAPGIGLSRPVRLLHPRYPLYIAPKPDDRYVIGATEIESEDASPVSVRSALELLSAAYTIHPGFGEARILELSTQCRPTLPDHRPAILWDGGRSMRVNGLYRHGFLIAPEVAAHAVAFAHEVLAGRLAADGVRAAWCAAAPVPALFGDTAEVASAAPDAAAEAGLDASAEAGPDATVDMGMGLAAGVK